MNNPRPSADPHRLVVVAGGVAGLDIASHLAVKATGSKRLRVCAIAELARPNG